MNWPFYLCPNLKYNIMKTKCMLLLAFFLLGIEVNAYSTSDNEEIVLSANDTPFDKPTGPEKGPRSIPMSIPFSAFLSDYHSIQLDFYQSIIGDVKIVISQNGMVVYTSTENISSPVLKEIQLSQDLSGDFLLEIKGSNGAYVFGTFNLN